MQPTPIFDATTGTTTAIYKYSTTTGIAANAYAKITYYDKSKYFYNYTIEQFGGANNKDLGPIWPDNQPYIKRVYQNPGQSIFTITPKSPLYTNDTTKSFVKNGASGMQNFDTIIARFGNQQLYTTGQDDQITIYWGSQTTTPKPTPSSSSGTSGGTGNIPKFPSAIKMKASLDFNAIVKAWTGVFSTNDKCADQFIRDMMNFFGTQPGGGVARVGDQVYDKNTNTVTAVYGPFYHRTGCIDGYNLKAGIPEWIGIGHSYAKLVHNLSDGKTKLYQFSGSSGIVSPPNSQFAMKWSFEVLNPAFIDNNVPHYASLLARITINDGVVLSGTPVEGDNSTSYTADAVTRVQMKSRIDNAITEGSYAEDPKSKIIINSAGGPISSPGSSSSSSSSSSGGGGGRIL